MEISDKRVWRCQVCRQETTPRCPFCRVVIGLAEAEEGRCDTCRSALPQSLADCPHCGAARALFFSPAIAYPQGLRGIIFAVLRSGRLLLGAGQFVGLILVALSLGGVLAVPAGRQPQNPLPLKEIGLVLFLGFIPLQVAITYAIFRLRRVPVQIGHSI